MVERMEIRGGAGEFEAALIAVVVDEIARRENQSARGKGNTSPLMPAWIRALWAPDDPNVPRDVVRPD